MIRRAAAILGVALGAHFLHDGLADIVYVLLPLWTAELHLSFAQAGMIRTAYTGGMALFQLPAGLLAERWGERRVLALGTMVTGLGYMVAGQSGAFLSLALVLLTSGLGSGVQHPLASSLVSKAFETGRRRAALGTYNFAGDLGKVSVPALVGLAAAALGWRVAGAAAGALAVLAAGLLLILLRRLGVGDESVERSAEPGAGAWGIRDPRGFGALTAIAMIDNASRTALLTFLPFVLIAKGLTVTGVGGALALVFAGGATGKFVCGLLAERLGVIRSVVLTEGATAAGILAVLAVPLPVALPILLPLGVALNGTSSVLHGTVADLVRPEGRSRGYGLYYTLAIGSSALAPTVSGVISDAFGVAAALVVTAIAVLVTIPLCLALRAVVAAPAPAT